MSERQSQLREALASHLGAAAGLMAECDAATLIEVAKQIESASAQHPLQAIMTDFNQFAILLRSVARRRG